MTMLIWVNKRMIRYDKEVFNKESLLHLQMSPIEFCYFHFQTANLNIVCVGDMKVLQHSSSEDDHLKPSLI